MGPALGQGRVQLLSKPLICPSSPLEYEIAISEHDKMQITRRVGSELIQRLPALGEELKSARTPRYHNRVAGGAREGGRTGRVTSTT